MTADSLTDPPHDAAAAPAEDDSAFPSEWLHYSGATSRGWVHLSIPRAADAPAAPPTGEEQVLRLAEAEALVACVEEWLHAGWDPAPAQEAPPAGALAAVVQAPALAPAGSRLALMPGLLPGDQPPAALLAPHLAWSAVTGQVLLGSVPAEAIQALEAGALVWLPAAFANRWAVTLHDMSRHLPPAAAWLDLPDARLALNGSAAPGSATQDETEGAGQAMLEQTVSIPLDVWLGWPRQGQPAFHWPLPAPWPAELCANGQRQASGALLPLGSGCGLHVQALES